MVDFRYHLISLIAVILALALGILAGSGFLGGPLLERLRREVAAVGRTNAELRAQIDVLDEQVSHGESFARLIEPSLVDGVLAGTEVVVFQFEGSEGDLIDGVKSGLTDAGAEVVSEITLLDKLALQGQPQADELALIIGSAEGNPAVLVEETAQIVGDRASVAASSGQISESPSSGVATQRFQTLADDLQEGDFLSMSVVSGGPVVPPGAQFVVIGGAQERALFDRSRIATVLGQSLADRGAPTAVVESVTSSWGIVQGVRGDVDARSRVVTVDNADTTAGRIALVLGLERAADGDVGHFGVHGGRTGIIPSLEEPE